ncbi:TerD family protein [Dactylosporangium sp. NPDC050588]|uniref:TerD family protein n=1 Tax=Dactylosporangium sp. NPDC050588 TaxID=3157211 RepID=UPI0033C3BBDE
MGFGIRLAPGIRLSVSSRGLRMGVGPRIARVHVGAGRVGFSSGIGPFSYYTSAGGRRRSGRRTTGSRSGGGPTRAQLAQLQRDARRQAAQEAYDALVGLERGLTSLHLEDFPVTVPPPDSGPEPVDRAAVLADLEQRELATLGRFDFSGRREARRRAQAALPALVAAEQAQRAATHHALRATEVAAWTSLVENDPGAVLDALEAAFADNESEAVGVNCEPAPGGAAVSLVVMVGTVDAMPDRKPTLTAAGAPSSAKRTKKERADLYLRWLASTVLATVKEAFAVAPGVTEARVLVIRRDPAATDPAGYLAAVYAGRFHRQALVTWNWALVNPVEELVRAPDARLHRKGAALQLVALDLHAEPELGAVLSAVSAAYVQGQSPTVPPSSLQGLPPVLPRELPPVFHIDDVTVPPMPKGANVPVPTTTVSVIVAWDPATAGADLDASALLCGGDGRVLNPDAMVFYNQPTGADGAARAAGRDRPSAASATDTITLDLGRMPADIMKVVVAVSLDGSGAPALAAVGRLRVAVTTDAEAVASFPLTGLTTETAAVAIEVYRRAGAWRVRAVGQGWTDGLAGLARDYGIDVTS